MQAQGRLNTGLVQRLVTICGPRAVLSDPASLSAYRSDALQEHRQTPALAVLPDTVEQVQRVLSACHSAAVPWVARGAGTGLSGGALPHPDGVLIVLSRLRRIVAVNLDDAELVAEAGVTPRAISRAAGPSHCFPLDPASQAVCTIGGAIGTNAAGAHAFKYGDAAAQLNGLDVVLGDGTLVELRRDRPGYDLLGAFTGSEGTLGIAVRAYLRLQPAPETTRTALAFFDSVVGAGDAVGRVVARGLTPSAMEVIDGVALGAATQADPGGYREDSGAALLLEFDGPQEETTATLEAVTALCSRAGARDLRVALDPEERAELWQTRAGAFAALRRAASAYYVQDAVVPRAALATVLADITTLAAEYGLTVAHAFNGGTGNLHPVICYPASSAEHAAHARALGGRISELCLRAGGSVAGEHGVGVDKLRDLDAMFAPADLAAFRRLQRAFDRSGLANPGKLLAPEVV